MKLPKLNSGKSLIVTVGIILLAFIIGTVYFKHGSSFVISSENSKINLPVTIPNNYGNTATALESNPSEDVSPSGIDAATAAAYSLQDNSELWSYKEGKRWPIASLTKLMTAVIANNLISPQQLITVSSTDEQYLINYAAAPTFKVGDTLTAKDLMTSMFVVSSDDAAEALADYYGRSQFIQAMNDMAKNLGMNDTVYVSPSGLSAQNLSTTADLYKLVEFIWSTEPNFFNTTKETRATVTVYSGNGSTAKVLTNIDKFAGTKDFLGGKTGTLPVSAENLIAIFNKNGPKAIIVLGSENRYAETTKILATL